MCDAKAACVLTYELVQEKPLASHKMRVHILDVITPLSPANDLQLHIPKFLMLGARFTVPNAQDANQVSNRLLSYSLCPSQHFRLDMRFRMETLDPKKSASNRLVLIGQDCRAASALWWTQTSMHLYLSAQYTALTCQRLHPTKLCHYEFRPQTWMKSPMGKSRTP
ncbi:protocadherin alpha-C1-like [Molossus molossus]|uniref:Protocadherin alpha subfamily C, 1 n=1 Tax=Molossus molossus TaxID=27622 RepID=A0A7J8JZP0_MOLMO|nr:protocadherin alpha-C1-like [Molossus molossus]KAF6501829.1 protocadherin alpha subfamily C, 1 [Molossus molossus]